jgi:hypothetical protein
MRIGRQALAVDFLPEVVELLLVMRPFQIGRA